jgi:Calcineurin-like phosphoesterase
MSSAELLKQLLTLTSMASLGAACARTPEPRRDDPAPSPPRQPAITSARPPAPSAAASSATYRFASSSRLVAIGDIHGDLRALRAALRLASAIDSDDRWIGKDLTVVQTGDQVDRGDQDREVLDVLEKLEDEAKAAGGSLHVLNGNHELMQASFDFRYVTPRSFQSFHDFSSRAPAAAQRLPDAERGRAAAFAPGAPYAQKLARHLTIAVVGDSLFAHAGVLPAHVDYGLARFNAEASAFLSGHRELSRALANDDSPVWTRAYGSPDVGAQTCAMLGRVLQEVGAKRLVVGHTVQKDGISQACGDRLFRIDVGLSAYYGNNPAQVLEITASGARILRATPARSADDASQERSPAVHSAP